MNMNKILLLLALCALCPAPAPAAPAKPTGEVPVAKGFPVWKGVVDENRVAGRRLCPSDLRDKVVVVVEFDAANAAKQLKACLGLTNRQHLDGMTSCYDFKMPTDLLIVCSNRGERNDDKVAAALKNPDSAAQMARYGTPVYNGLVLEGGPDAGGMYPFFYILGPRGGEPLLKGTVNRKSVAEAVKVIKKATKGMAEWKPFTGRGAAESKTGALVAKAVAAGKPLAPLYKTLLTAIAKAKDEASAAEAQQAYDALERTRSDLSHRVVVTAAKSPACAYRDYELVSKYWPMEKSRLADAFKKMSAFKEGPTLGRYCTLLTRAANGELTPAEQKKLAADAKRIASELERMKGSANVKVQDDAHTLARLLESATLK